MSKKQVLLVVRETTIINTLREKNYLPSRRKRLERCERRSVGVHGDQQDTGHQDEEEKDPPHPSAGHVTHHSDESANIRKGRIMRMCLRQIVNRRCPSRLQLIYRFGMSNFNEPRGGGEQN